MKKIISLFLTVLLTLSLTACGGEPKSPADVKGEVYETSLISVLVPEGWMAFPSADIFDEYPDEPGDPHGVRIHKGAKNEWSQFTTPGIQIEYTPADKQLMVLKDFYEDAEDLEPLTTGDYTWQGFSATSLSTKLLVLWVTEPYQIQISIFPEMGKKPITLQDADVQAILMSIKVNGEEPAASAGSTETTQPATTEGTTTQPATTEGTTTQPAPSGGSKAKGALSMGSEATTAPSANTETAPATPAAVSTGNALLDWWNGDWYGRWTITGGDGAYEKMNGQWWDVCGNISIGDDMMGTVLLWDEDYTKEEPMVWAAVSLSESGTGEHGAILSEGGWFTDQELKHADWIVDPGLAEKDNMIWLDGWCESKDGEYHYDFYLRPWGTKWDDMEQSQRPASYDSWYLPMINANKAMPDSIGADAQATMAPADNTQAQAGDGDYGLSNASATGETTLEKMRALYATLKKSKIYYAEARDALGCDGVPWKDRETTWSAETHGYKWESKEEDAFLYIIFQVEDGKEQYTSCTYSRNVREAE